MDYIISACSLGFMPALGLLQRISHFTPYLRYQEPPSNTEFTHTHRP